MMFTVGAGTMFLAALVLRRFGIAVLFFLLCLGTREDAGLHLFALLAPALIWQWRRGTPASERTPFAMFAAAALFYSIAVMALQHAFAATQSLLVSEYLGDPLFAGVTVSELARRLLGWAAFRGYVVYPAILAIVWAILRRSPQIALGYAAFAPWGLLHLAAAADFQATLPSYYAFPYMFAALWPLLGFLVQPRRTEEHRFGLEPLAGFALLAAVSFVPAPYQHNPTHIDLPADFVSPPSIARQAATDRALQRLASAGELGTQLVDQSVLALVPERYRRENFLSLGTHSAPDSALGQRSPDTIIYFAHGFESELARRMAADSGLSRTYAVPGTAIRAASRRAALGTGGLVELPPP